MNCTAKNETLLILTERPMTSEVAPNLILPTHDRYYAKVQAERTARQERFKAEKAKEEASRREEEIVRLREEAKAPAYAGEIEDCTVLIGWFKGKYNKGEVPSTHTGSSTANGIGKSTAALQGVKEHEIRQVDNDFKGMTLKKKGDDEMDGLFGGGFKSKKKGGKKSTNGSGTSTPVVEKPESVNLPMSLLSALLALGIPPPSGKEDVQRTVDDLETKKAWFEANSEAKTKVFSLYHMIVIQVLTCRPRSNVLRSLSQNCRRRTQS